MFASKKDSKLTKRQSFASVPQIVPGLLHKKNEHDLVVITLHRLDNPTAKAAGKFFKIPDTKPLILDELGSEVWSLIDGKRTVHDIIKIFAAEKKLHRRESEMAILEYLKKLVKKKLVHIIVQK